MELQVKRGKITFVNLTHIDTIELFYVLSWPIQQAYCGPLWSFMALCGLLWPFVDICGLLWSFMVFCSVLWSFVSFLWPFIAFNGHLCHCPALFTKWHKCPLKAKKGHKRTQSNTKDHKRPQNTTDGHNRPFVQPWMAIDVSYGPVFSHRARYRFEFSRSQIQKYLCLFCSHFLS